MDNSTELEYATQAGVEENSGVALENGPEDETAQKLAETESKLAYLNADFENYKRQTFRRLDDERLRAQRSILNDLLPALDNFSLAQRYADRANDVASLKIGLDFVAQQMESALQSAGLEPIAATGQTFDPTLHEALEEVESDLPSGTVVEETTRGYRFGGTVLRPAQVKVAK